MKKYIVLAALFLLMVSCGGKYGAGVPAHYHSLLDEAFRKAGDNAAGLREALSRTPRDQREGMAFLIAYMPEGDLVSIDTQMLSENVDYAYRARREFEWAGNLPDDIFMNEVLPYASVVEKRENWRPLFYDMFSKRVKGAPDVFTAIENVNRNLPAYVEVEYNTAREKTNQSPSESMRQHIASCTGLSILLIDALRSVGIPARFAGTPNWHDDRGNHSWVEVWIDGEWYFTEFYYEQLNRAWFLADAGQADPEDRGHAIYATSYKPTGDWFPMTWAARSREVPGINVSERYINIWKDLMQARTEAGTHVQVTFKMYRDSGHTSLSGDRVAANVDVFREADQMGGGRTAGPTQDMNDALTFSLEKNAIYTFRYTDSKGRPAEVTAEVKETPLTVVGYMND